jgi:hypothetical protein
MAILSGLTAIFGRFAGKVLNTLLGWATILLFGKVSGRRQTLLLTMALGSLLWIVVLVGVLVPDLGTALLAFVPAPDVVSDDLIRLAMIVAALVVPLLVGIGAVLVTDASERRGGASAVAAVVRGYPFTLLLATTIAFLAAVAVARRLGSLRRRWEDAHVPVIVEPGAYETVVAQLHDVLQRGGIESRPMAASRLLSAPPRLLAAVAGPGVKALVPERLTVLKASDLDVLVYPSDIAISGPKSRVAEARTLIATELTDAPAYLTTSQEGQVIEDQLRAASRLASISPEEVLDERMPAIDAELRRLALPFDEWETLYRQRLQVATEALGQTVGGLEGAEAVDTSAEPESRGWRAAVIALTVIIAAEVVLLVAERIRPPVARS